MMKRNSLTDRSRIGLAALFLGLIPLLSGCTIFDGSLESLLYPPKLTETQTAIYNALILSKGEQIDLIYPAGGEYRSAFVLYDLDGDGSKEAIVFYREPPSENSDGGLRMNFLDQSSGSWTSVTDRPVSGTKIEGVNFYSFDGTVTVAVAVSASVQAEKTLSLLKYSDGTIKEQAKLSYSFLEAVDLDSDGYDELFYVSYDTIMGYNHARILGARENETDAVTGVEETVLDVLSTVPLYSDVSSVQRLHRQKLNENESLLFIDYSKGDNAYGTQLLLSYRSNLTQVMSENLSRRSNSATPLLYCTDLDADTRIEVPVTTAFLGYENMTVPEQLYAIEWYYADEQNNNTMTKKFTTYINSGADYMFYIPVRWQGLVTVQRSSGVTSFVKYDADSLTLLSICVSDTKPEGEGWERFQESNVYVKGAEKDDPMVLTNDELTNCMTVLKFEN